MRVSHVVGLKGKAIIGADFHRQLDKAHHVKKRTGLIGEAHSHISGGAVIIPRCISDILGYWCEDYGLYGCEDGDYGLRIMHTNFKQFYFDHRPFMNHNGKDSENYINSYNIDKKKIQDHHRNYFATASFLLKNNYRSPNTPMRYKISRFDGYNIELCLVENYQKIWKKFESLHETLQHTDNFQKDAFVRALNALISTQNTYWQAAIAEADAAYSIHRITPSCL